MEKFITGWYVMYTKPRHEKKVRKQLELLEINAYLPTVKTLSISSSNRRKYIDMPLLPSYVFVNLKNGQSYFDSLAIKGSLSYVKSDKQIARINDVIIDAIKLMFHAGKKDMEVSSEFIEQGKKLCIVQGVFAGFCCEVIRHNGKLKMLVRLDLWRRNILIDVPSDCLVPTS